MNKLGCKGTVRGTRGKAKGKRRKYKDQGVRTRFKVQGTRHKQGAFCEFERVRKKYSIINIQHPICLPAGKVFKVNYVNIIRLTLSIEY
jgi:hypothetical protein